MFLPNIWVQKSNPIYKPHTHTNKEGEKEGERENSGQKTKSKKDISFKSIFWKLKSFLAENIFTHLLQGLH